MSKTHSVYPALIKIYFSEEDGSTCLQINYKLYKMYVVTLLLKIYLLKTVLNNICYKITTKQLLRL